MRAVLASVAILAASSHAWAESRQPVGFVALGGAFALTQGPAMAGIQLEAGVRLGELPVYARLMLEGGTADTVLDHGDYSARRIGLEVRGPHGVFLGADIGARRIDLVISDSAKMETLHSRDAIVVPRAGIDIGSRVRGRFAAELPISLEDKDQWGIGVTAAVGYAF